MTRMNWIDATMTQARHVRATLAHVAGEPGSGSPFMADLDVLDTDAWQLVQCELIDPSDKAPKGFERIDAALTDLLGAVSAARDNLRCFADPTSAGDAWDLFDEEVNVDADFGEEIDKLNKMVRAVGDALERAAEDEAEARAA